MANLWVEEGDRYKSRVNVSLMYGIIHFKADTCCIIHSCIKIFTCWTKYKILGLVKVIYSNALIRLRYSEESWYGLREVSLSFAFVTIGIEVDLEEYMITHSMISSTYLCRERKISYEYLIYEISKK